MMYLFRFMSSIKHGNVNVADTQNVDIFLGCSVHRPVLLLKGEWYIYLVAKSWESLL